MSDPYNSVPPVPPYQPSYTPPGYPTPARARREPGSRLPLLMAILLGLLAGWMLYRAIDDHWANANAEPRTVTPRGDLASDEKTTIQLFENASPSVVFVTSVALSGDMFGLNVTEIPQGTGSGFIWDQQGHVVTNFHVIQKANTIEVTLSDHSNWKAEVVGAAPDNDIAVLQLTAPASRLRPIPVGSSKDLQVGQKVFAIGNPFGLDQSLTTGIVSALGRTIPAVTGRTIRDVIQTDAAINPGNSGGPLLDSAGRLIGVNTAIYSPTGTSSGVGFAVPVDAVNRVVPELIAHGKVVRPRLGVHTAPEQLTRRHGIKGVLIMRVEEGSGAAKAGLRGTRQSNGGDIILGDVVKSIDGKAVESNDELLSILEDRKAGDTVKVGIERDGQRRTVEVTLQ